MFCLRSWIPILFFLTNASPIYLILFITATYVLNRPCVYCSLLLAILVISLFDFNSSSWFEPRYTHPTSFLHVSDTSATLPATTLLGNASALLPGAVLDALDLVTSVVANSTAASVVGSVVGSLKSNAGSGASEGSSGLEWSVVGEWARSLLRREWRIGCFDVALRL